MKHKQETCDGCKNYLEGLAETAKSIGSQTSQRPAVWKIHFLVSVDQLERHSSPADLYPLVKKKKKSIARQTLF